MKRQLRDADIGMKMKWEKLLSKKRLYSMGEEGNRSPFQRDFDRIAFSSAFRRLQDKAQVFPLAESDYVRTRLTHSIEASCVARSLGLIVGKKIIKRYKLNNYSPSDFGAIVAAASLAHDIGNPPLGHSGEDAVQHWFRKPGKRFIKDFTEADRKDFVDFEGNAQGFRVLTRLQRPFKKGGMQLTCATLAAFTKYPRQSYLGEKDLDEKEQKILKGISFRKFGFFQSERPIFFNVAKEVGLISAIDKKAWYRHPLAFLVEAADDICYTIVDFEDGVRLGHIKYKKAENLLLKIIPKSNLKKFKKELKNTHGEKEKIECLRSKVINELINQVTKHFIDNEGKILAGKFNEELMKKIDAGPIVSKILDLSKKDIYTADGVVEIEAAGYEVIAGLLQTFIVAVSDLAVNKKKASKKSNKILQLIPEQFLKSKGEVDDDPYLRIIKVTDYVSGMTDSFAVSTYKKIKGISLPQS